MRGYDLTAGQLLPGSLGTKGETVQMQGLARHVVASPDGRWLLTLYVNTETNTAFVHALNLIERIAICIDMPPCTKCAPEALRRWALALAPDGRTLFAANPALGRVAEVHLPTARVIYSARFRGPRAVVRRARRSRPTGRASSSRAARRLWSYDTHRGFARSLRSGAGAIADLGVSRDGSRLFVARAGAAPLSLEL